MGEDAGFLLQRGRDPPSKKRCLHKIFQNNKKQKVGAIDYCLKINDLLSLTPLKFF